MSPTEERIAELLTHPGYPRSGRYDPRWIVENEAGTQRLWLMESLTQAVALEPGMRVLDMGCGKAIGAIFLAKEFGVQVWANDPSISPSDNWRRIRQAGVEGLVYPIRAEAHALPYAEEFFDAILSVDSLQHYGTDNLYLGEHLGKLLRLGGRIGIVVPGLLRQLDGVVPEHLQPFWEPSFWAWHTADWWRRHWDRSGLVEVELADAMPGADGWKLWLRWQEATDRVGLIEADRGRYVSYIRVVARRV